MSDTAVLPRTHTLIDKALRPVELVAALVGGAMMITAMVLTSADALLRYGINMPLTFNYFFTEYYLMVGLVCMPLSWAFRTGGYIRISFMIHMLPERWAHVMLRGGFLLGCVYIADLAWLSALEWHKTYASREVEMGVIDWPWSWSWIWVPIGLSILAVRLFLTTIGPAEDLVNRHDNEEEAI